MLDLEYERRLLQKQLDYIARAMLSESAHLVPSSFMVCTAMDFASALVWV